MNKELAQNPISDIDRKKDLIKSLFFKADGTDDEFELFMQVCNLTGLNPFTKQIYPVFRNNRALGKKVMVIQTSIDGYRLIAERTGKYCPGREPLFSYSKDGSLISATSYVKKQTRDGTWHEVSSTAFWKEYAQTDFNGKLTQFWDNMPHLMLAKCAESLALRRAFPAEFSSIYTEDEMNNPITRVNEASVQEVQSVEHVQVENKTKELTTEEFCLALKTNEKVGDKYHLQDMDSYLEELTNSKGVPISKIKEQALNPVLVERFCKSWKIWYDAKSKATDEALES